MIYFEICEYETKGHTDIHDVTEEVISVVEKSTVKEGQVGVYVSGSTAGLTSIEYEPGLVRDLKEMWERLIPSDEDYYHNATWGDGNGFSHVRAALLKSSFHAPVHEGRIVLGTWQQIVLIDFDARPRRRGISVQVIGE